MMKRNVVTLVLVVLMGLCFVSAGFAQGVNPATEKEVFLNKLALAKSVSFEGTVLSHDVLCHCIVVKTAKGNLTIQDDYTKFMDEYDRAKGLKIGSKVKGTYKTVDYINYATDLANAK